MATLTSAWNKVISICQAPFIEKSKWGNLLALLISSTFVLARQFKHPQEIIAHLILFCGFIIIFFFNNFLKLKLSSLLILFAATIFAGYFRSVHFVGFDDEWLINNGNLWNQLGSRSFWKVYTSLPWSGGQHPPGSLFIAKLFSPLGIYGQKFVGILCFLFGLPALKILTKDFFSQSLIALLSIVLFSRLIFGINNDVLLFLALSWFHVCYFEKRNFILAGLFLGLSFWIKYFSLFYFGILSLCLLIYDFKNLKNLLLTLFIALLIFLPWVGILHHYGIWHFQMNNILFHAVDNPELVSKLNEGRTRLFFYLPDNIFSVGPLMFLFLLLCLQELWKVKKVFFWYAFLAILFFIAIQPTNRYFIPLYIVLLFSKELKEFILKTDWQRISLYQLAILIFYVIRGFSQE